MPSYQHITPALSFCCGPERLALRVQAFQRLQPTRALVGCGPWVENLMPPAVQTAIGFVVKNSAALLDAVIARVLACLQGPGAEQQARDVEVTGKALPTWAHGPNSDRFLTGNQRRVEHAAELLPVLVEKWQFHQGDIHD